MGRETTHPISEQRRGAVISTAPNNDLVVLPPHPPAAETAGIRGLSRRAPFVIRSSPLSMVEFAAAVAAVDVGRAPAVVIRQADLQNAIADSNANATLASPSTSPARSPETRRRQP